MEFQIALLSDIAFDPQDPLRQDYPPVLVQDSREEIGNYSPCKVLFGLSLREKLYDNAKQCDPAHINQT